MNDFKRKMKEKIKEYSDDEYLKGYIKSEYNTEDNDVDIFLNIENKDELFDKRTVGKQLAINDDIYLFLEEKTAMFDNDVPINLHIIGFEFDAEEQEKIKHLFKEHYSIELYKAQKEYKNIRNQAINMITIGIIALIIYFFLVMVFPSVTIPTEIFAFLFSFSLWEALSTFIYTLSAAKDKREAVTQNLLTNVEFE